MKEFQGGIGRCPAGVVSGLRATVTRLRAVASSVLTVANPPSSTIALSCYLARHRKTIPPIPTTPVAPSGIKILFGFHLPPSRGPSLIAWRASFPLTQAVHPDSIRP